jgi:predicted nucleic acid-binding protein
VYLIDTNVISEARKRNKANRGVRRFFDKVRTHDEPLFVSVITVGEIRRGNEEAQVWGACACPIMKTRSINKSRLPP